jgi:hypothetical protein
MPNRLKPFVFALTTALFITSQGTCARENAPKPLIIDVRDSPTISFSIPHPASIKLSLLPSRNAYRAIGYIHLTQEDCIIGYKGKLDYIKNDRERFFSYFSTETPWSNTGTLIISQDKETNELSVTLNGEMLKVQPQERVKFLRVEGTPPPITIDNVDTANH